MRPIRRPLNHVVGRDLRVPGRGVGHRRPVKPEEAPGDLEQALTDRLEGEVRPHSLRVDGELLLPNQLGVVRHVRPVDVGGIGAVLLQAPEQDALSRAALSAERSVIRSMNSAIALPLPIIFTSAS